MKKRMIAVLLALAMILGLFGCAAPAEPTEPALIITEPTEEPTVDAVAIFEAACESWKIAENVTLQISTERITEVTDQTYRENEEQTLTYAGWNSENPMILLSHVVPVWDLDDVTEEMVANDTQYQELYADGVLYVELEDMTKISSKVSYEALADRYVPVVPLTPDHYEQVTLIEASSTPVVTFSQPVAAESWAVPAEAELIDATGKAFLNADGTIEYTYEVSYTYGPATIRQTTDVKTLAEAQSVAAPENAEDYVDTQCAQAMAMFLRADRLTEQAESGSYHEICSTYSQAAGQVLNDTTALNIYGRDADLLIKMEYDLFYKDYASDQEVSSKQTIEYQNGKASYTVDEGLPTSSKVSSEDMWSVWQNAVHATVPMLEFCQNVTWEDLGSLYYLEFTYNEDAGDQAQNDACITLWGDPSVLNNLASTYRQEKMTGYVSVDKYTGVLVAAGYAYEGYHTIAGEEYMLSNQTDVSLSVPCLGAYKEITEELPPETEPEQKATPLFYHVTGEDGQEMWLLGTIHVGDNRTAYLPQEIYDAFAASDALALECDTEAFDEKVEEDDKLQEQISALYYYTDGSMIKDHIDEELYTQAVKYLRATGNYNMNADYMKPSVWSSSIETFFMQQGRSLTSEQGVEERLTKLAHEQEKKILEVESSIFQIKMTTGWSEELQELLLKESLEYSGAAYYDGVYELYELWCDGDEEAMRQEISTEEDTSEMTPEELEEYEANKKLYEEYDTAMSTDRNEGMLDKAIEYLESGDVIFFAVGLAHLLDNTNGLVDTLREAGYTVELVAYE